MKRIESLTLCSFLCYWTCTTEAFKRPSFLSSPKKLETSELVIVEDESQPVRREKRSPPRTEEIEAPNITSTIEDSLEIPTWVKSNYRRRGGKLAGVLNVVPRNGELNVELRSESANWVEHDDAVSMSMDVVSFVRLASLGIGGALGFGSALWGTLRCLAPLLVARRGVHVMLVQGQDWYTGRTIRTTVERIEDKYWKGYQMHATLRSMGRLSVQMICLFLLGKIMESMVGLSIAPCASELGGCQTWCGLLWLVAVVGTGHACGAAVAVWGGPLRISVPRVEEPVENPPALDRLLKHPKQFVKWLRNPDQWIQDVANRRASPKDDRDTYGYSFQPNRIMFPATWEPLVLLQMFVVASEMNNNRKVLSSLMRWVLVQQSLSDEWFRALLCEKRVGLGLGLAVGYLLASLRLFWICATQNDVSALLFLVPLCAIMISTWMNCLIYLERRSAKHQEEDDDGADREILDVVAAAPPVSSMEGWQQAMAEPSSWLSSASGFGDN